MVVALGAPHGEAEESGRDGVDLVGDPGHLVFRRKGAALVGVHRVAEEAGGDLLVLAGTGHEVARELLAEELVVGEVVLEGGDDPVAPRPHVAVVVERVAVGVGKACHVEPFQCESFGECSGLHHPIDRCLVSRIVRVAQEGIQILQTRRQSGQVQMQTAEERFR